MPSPNRPSFWPFIKELFFNKQSVTGFIKDNKLLSFSFLANVIFIAVCLFALEQTIQKTKQILDLRNENRNLKGLTSKIDCGLELEKAQQSYDKLYKLYATCQNNDNSPIPQPKPKRDPVIITRPLMSDDSLKRKLDDIR